MTPLPRRRLPPGTDDGRNRPAGISGLAGVARRLMLRTSAGPLRPVWALAYRLAARFVAVYLRKGHPDCAVYALGEPAGPDAVYGVSDIDLAAVGPALPGHSGELRDGILAHWERLGRRLPPLRSLVSVKAFEIPELERGIAGAPSLSLEPPAGPPRNDALSQSSRFYMPPFDTLRGGLGLPATSWKRLAGLDRAAPLLAGQEHEPRIAAWLELQYWWHHAFGACLDPDGQQVPYMCVKLAAEPARIWIWLTTGERIATRREALELGVRALPDERETFERALSLQASLHRAPEPPLREMLAAFVRLSGRIARLLASETEPAGATKVALTWGGEEELIVAPQALSALRAFLGAEPRLLPLADARTLIYPVAMQDETFAVVPGSPSDPSVVAALALAGAAGPCPTLMEEGLLVLPAPTATRTKLRGVNCPLTDPVSFALLEGSSTAAFPNLAGWSIREIAARAVVEHREWLARSAEKNGEKGGITRLFTAARAALLWESVDAGAPELPLTLRATTARLGARYPAAQILAAESYEAYAAWRRREIALPGALVARFRERIVELPVYR